MAKHFILKNGTRVCLVPFAGTKATTVLVFCKVGSRYESVSLQGASHFIEHLMFKGTTRRPNTLAISRALDAVGAQFNAFTGKDATGYYVKADHQHAKLAIDLLHDMLFHSKYDPKELNRERGVIIEEINMYEDNPMSYVENLLEQGLFQGNPLADDIAGTHKSMRAMKRSDILTYRDSYYQPSRLVICVSGHVDEQVTTWLEETFGRVKAAGKKPEDFTPFVGWKDQQEPRIIVKEKAMEQVQLALGFPAYSLYDKKLRAAKLLAIILGGTMSSRLFIAVRERRGLAYFVRSWIETFEDTGYLTIRAGLDKSRLPLALKTIFNECRAIKRKGAIRVQELKDAKEYVRGKTLLAMEDSFARAEWYGQTTLFHEKEKTIEGYLKEIADVRMKDVEQVAQEMLRSAQLTIAAIGPYANKEALKKSAGLSSRFTI